MKIIEVGLKELNLQNPINVRGKQIEKLTFTNIVLDDLRHYQIQTLPNFHQIPHVEKVKEALLFLEKCKELKNFDDFSDLNYFLNYNKIHPEVQFSLESILLNKCFLKKPTYLSCKINELYLDDKNYQQVLKIKIAPNFNPQIFSSLANHLTFRLDGNRLFAPLELKNFLKQIPSEVMSRIEYVEEPCENYLDSLNILNEFKLKLAIDETLSDLFNQNQLENIDSKIAYAVIKPSLIGLINSYHLINSLFKRNITSIISSSFELNTGMNSLLFLADKSNQLHNKELYHGLDTMKFFAPEYFDTKIKEDQISLFY